MGGGGGLGRLFSAPPPEPLLVTLIERVHNNGNEKSFKLLGVYSDEFLSFDSHISQLCKKISKTLLSLNKIKIFVNVDALENSLMRSCIRPLPIV